MERCLKVCGRLGAAGIAVAGALWLTGGVAMADAKPPSGEKAPMAQAEPPATGTVEAEKKQLEQELTRAREALRKAEDDRNKAREDLRRAQDPLLHAVGLCLAVLAGLWLIRSMIDAFFAWRGSVGREERKAEMDLARATTEANARVRCARAKLAVKEVEENSARMADTLRAILAALPAIASADPSRPAGNAAAPPKAGWEQLAELFRSIVAAPLLQREGNGKGSRGAEAGDGKTG